MPPGSCGTVAAFGVRRSAAQPRMREMASRLEHKQVGGPMAGRIPVMTCSFSRSFGSARAAGLDVSDDQFLTPLKNRC